MISRQTPDTHRSSNDARPTLTRFLALIYMVLTISTISVIQVLTVLDFSTITFCLLSINDI